MTTQDTKKVNVTHEVARRLIEALEQRLTPWQQPWKSQPSMRPMNPLTGQPYRGIDRVLLGLQGMTADGHVDNTHNVMTNPSGEVVEGGSFQSFRRRPGAPIPAAE